MACTFQLLSVVFSITLSLALGPNSAGGSPIGVIPGELAQYVLPAMQTLQRALRSGGLDHIKASTSIATSVLGESYLPLTANFSEAAMAYKAPIARYLNDITVPLLANVYTYFSYSGNSKDIPLPYALFTSNSAVVTDGGLSYYNLFDAMVDGLYASLEKAAAPRVQVVVSEAGWPSDGNGNVTAPGNAQTYNSNLIKHVLSSRGTPRLPGSSIETYIFSMFNENMKPGDAVEQHRGLFYPNKSSVYPINFGSKRSRDIQVAYYVVAAFVIILLLIVPGFYCRNVSSCLYKGSHGGLPWTHGSSITLRSALAVEFPIFLSDTRSLSTQVKAPAQARQMGALRVAMLSPGFIYEPYTPREKVSFFKRWFTRSGWKRTKEDIIIELKSAYAIAKLRKKGYSKNLFYKEAINLYKEELKNEIKQRDSIWSKVYWELVEPVVKIRTLRARLIGVDRNDLEKVFIQLTLEFLTKQKFEAYDSKGAVVAGDKSKEKLSFLQGVSSPRMYRKCIPVRLRRAILPNNVFLDILSCSIGKGNAIFGEKDQRMDRREEHFQFLGICQRLYNFITRSLASQPFKTVKLGPPMNQRYPETAISDANPNEAGTRRGRNVRPMAREYQTQDQVTAVAHQAEASKKMVSIHHRVEDIDEVMKLRRKSLKKLKCLEVGRDEPRPLRSILKVGSDLEREDGHI
ncbi:hypothetical protein DVH24_036668 [Malus domestica]|uniref:glucan endo-1,3-beta-D-glucosidase n=1 Tax=Malus domestica TaxID=3750 RepID=A0A498IJR3_MALDO|nr:hypothetical protein DVH24_036668 [Malus domestica]